MMHKNVICTEIESLKIYNIFLTSDMSGDTKELLLAMYVVHRAVNEDA